MNVLYLYNATQTYTATVFEHLASFRKYSKHRSFFVHQDQFGEVCADYSLFDAIVIHYTIRLPFDQIAEQNARSLSTYKGLKALFIQDEYDHSHRAWAWIKRLGIQLVFTVVPQNGIPRVYPPHEFPGIRFISVLTGYAPEDLFCDTYMPPSQRQLTIGYRGRPLPIRYGALGQEKVAIARLVKDYCKSHAISQDIAWTEEARIYGHSWYEFMASCRSMLGSESGSNVFDWDGTLVNKIETFKKVRRVATDEDIYEELIRPLEIPGLMNQISPRIFEAIALRTVLVLFEGSYSGVIVPNVHFIPLKKDGSNLDEVFRLLADGVYVDAMAERAYQDVIVSGKYRYHTFVHLVDEEIALSVNALQQQENRNGAGFLDPLDSPTPITTSPVRAMPPQPPISTVKNIISDVSGIEDLAKRLAFYLWIKLPDGIKDILRPRLKQLLGRR